MKLAFKFIFMTEDVTPVTWSLWIGAQLDLQDMLASEEDIAPEPSRKTTPESIETIDLTGSPEPPSRLVGTRSYGLPTPPSSLPSKTLQVAECIINNGQHKPTSSSTTRPVSSAEHSRRPVPPRRIESYKTLQDFYSLLDKIERTSYAGVLYLEASAEKPRDDMCKSCWLKHNINLDLF
jgi:hypothetical protein